MELRAEWYEFDGRGPFVALVDVNQLRFMQEMGCTIRICKGGEFLPFED